MALAHATAAGAFPAGAGELVVQGEDVGAPWITAQRVGWDRLTPAQQYLLGTLSIEAPAEGEVVVPVRRSQDERWNTNLAAARQFHTREEHLTVPLTYVEVVDGEPIQLRAIVDNSRRGAARLSPERQAAPDGLEMR
ncbi:helicase associated domain-containing protein [Streptomyces sp. NPDC006285]|uniref:helicase associated domain-containing protein n=1 Tax=Streptomyces sp. NPDC006285 TaxID=3364742 RepID=UPI0036762B06